MQDDKTGAVTFSRRKRRLPHLWCFPEKSFQGAIIGQVPGRVTHA